jgi:hypothetical protein
LSHILRFVIVVFYSSMEVAMYLRNILALVSHVVLYFLAATSSSVFGQQTFNGNTTFNGNVFMKGLVTGTTAGGGGPWFDVKAFGAKGDGVTNDRLAIQAAINAAGANTMAGSTTVMVGGTVYFPPGRYLIHGGSLIDRPSASSTSSYINIELRGAGNAGWGGTSSVGMSSLIIDDAFPILDFGSAGSGGHPFGVHITNLGFEDKSTGTTRADGAIRIRNEYHIRLDDVACEGFTNAAANKGYCVRLEALQTGNVVQYATVIDLKSRNTKVGLQCAGNCSQVVMLGGHLTAPPQAGGVYPGSIGIDYQQPSSVPSEFGDALQVINTSIESFEIGINLVNVDLCRIGARLENTTAGASYHKGTGIAISGTNPSRKANGNVVMESSLVGFMIGIQVGTNTQRTQIIGN